MTDDIIRQFKERFVSAFNHKINDRSLAKIITKFYDKVFLFDEFNADEFNKFRKQYPEEFRLIERKCNMCFY